VNIELVWFRCVADDSLRLRYPAAVRKHVHITKAYIPVDIARALSVNPSLVQKPVETFYTRDAIQLRVSAVIHLPLISVIDNSIRLPIG